MQYTYFVFIYLFIYYLLTSTFIFYYQFVIVEKLINNKEEPTIVPQIKLNAGSESWTGVTIFF